MLTLLLLLQSAVFAAPVASLPIDSFRVALFGDSQDNATGAFRPIVSAISAGRPSLVVCLGDMIQHGDRSATIPESEWLTLFLDPMGPLLSVPRIAVRGNHDSNIGTQTFVCPLPLQSGIGLWQAFDVGDSIWVMADANDETFELRTSMDPGHPQRIWIDAMIQSQRWRSKRWRFFATHQPAVTTVWYSGCGYSNYATQQWLALGDRLSAAGCHVWFSGHAHGLERAQWRTGNMWRITSGGAGGALDVVCGQGSAFSAGVNGFHEMDVESDRLLIRALNPQGVELDQIVIR